MLKVLFKTLYFYVSVLLVAGTALLLHSGIADGHEPHMMMGVITAFISIYWVYETVRAVRAKLNPPPPPAPVPVPEVPETPAPEVPVTPAPEVPTDPVEAAQTATAPTQEPTATPAPRKRTRKPKQT